jgi:hypothetical protein
VFIGMPPDDLDWLERESLYYPALPVLLYLLAYATLGVYAYFMQLFSAALGRVVAALLGGWVLVSFLNEEQMRKTN